MLEIRRGERGLEVGVGTGCGLISLAGAAESMVLGVALSPLMLRRARGRAIRAGLRARVALAQADATRLPFRMGAFDAVYMFAVLELFDTPDIPVVLGEVRRVLAPSGRLGVGSLCREGHERSLSVRAYEWLHRHLLWATGCRPIYVEPSLVETGFRLLRSEEVLLGGVVPMKLAVATPGALQ